MNKPQKKKYVEKIVSEEPKQPPKKQYQAKINDYIPKLKKKEQGNKPGNIEFMQKQESKQKKPKTQVINVKAKFLREKGFKNLEEWLENPSHIYIGRNMTHYVPGAVGSKWANPFKVDEYGRQGCIEKYREYVLSKPELSKCLFELKGKVLGCWCAPEGCHGDVLAELADNIKQEEE